VREIGDRFRHYDRLAIEHDRRKNDTRSILGQFSSLGDGMREFFHARITELEEREPTLRDIDGPIGLSLELAVQHAQKRAAYLGLSESGFASAVNRGVGAIADNLQLCESPIEKRMLPWLVFEDYGPLLTFPAVVHDAKKELEVPKGDIMVVPQFAFAKFRLDFGLVARWKKQTKIVAVECDGSSFHGAKRDHTRDAYLWSWGIPTVRASGNEIHNEPRTVSARAAAIISDWALEL
jgi:hypothetical protein